MKTKTQKTAKGLGSRSAQSSSENNKTTASAPATAPVTATATAPTERKDTRLPIDRQQRTQNRTLPTPKVLNQLLNTLPDVYGLAEVVGKWVWVQFDNTPAAEIRQKLSQLGFHWNGQRQTWQHPCGQFAIGSRNDPHEKYSSYFPSDTRAA